MTNPAKVPKVVLRKVSDLKIGDVFRESAIDSPHKVQDVYQISHTEVRVDLTGNACIDFFADEEVEVFNDNN